MTTYPDVLYESPATWGEPIFFTAAREPAIRADLAAAFGRPVEDDADEYDFVRLADGGAIYRCIGRDFG